MRKIIHHLRNKSEKERRDILYLATIIFALLLLAAWIYSLGQNFSDPNTQRKLSEDLEPFYMLKDDLAGGHSNILEPDLELEE